MGYRSPLALLVLLTAVGGAAWGGRTWWQQSSQPVVSAPAGAEPRTVAIAAGTPAQRIGEILVEADLIQSARAWRLWTLWQQRVRQRDGGFQAGTYVISPTESLPDIAEQIWAGDVRQQQVVIPEGWSRQQMAERFAERGWFAAEDFLAATAEIPRDRFPWLPPDVPHLEGFLFPDTYFFPAGESLTPVQVRDRLLAQFEAVALPLYQQALSAGEPPATAESLLAWTALASLVEKEAVIAAERGTIAGVFANRLQRGMPLASDPTVEYAFGVVQTPERPLTLAEVRTPSPYNTYLNPGLPPTPIASPGLASLQAALDPEPTEYLFFVARYDGTHVFSRTYAEHSRAQRRIQGQR